MRESAKISKRLKAEGVFDRYITGRILDVGCGDSPITSDAETWDVEQGDAQTLAGVPDGAYDTLFSSHCLEHLRSPGEALRNWWRVLKFGGHLVVAVPDETLYERNSYPSIGNPDHKATFNISSSSSWSPRSFNLTELLSEPPNRKVISIRTIDTNYDYSKSSADCLDQTLGNAEAAIEFIVQKVPDPDGFRTSLKGLVLCPACGRNDMVVIGKGQDGLFQLQCHTCGENGVLGVV